MGFGRVIRGPDGRILEIVEEKVATPEQLQIRELNAGVYCFRQEWLWDHLGRLPLSPVGEYYLTDLIGMAVAEGGRVQAYTIHDVGEVQGVNTRVHLARAEALMRRRINEHWMLEGVTFVDPNTAYVEADVVIGRDTVIYPNTCIQGKTTIGEKCEIGPNTVIRDGQIADRCRIFSSVVEQAVLEEGCHVGPYGHLRPGTHLAKEVYIGSFGEVKNSHLGPGTKVGHFSYLGDALIGANVNIGAGTVTCNYDGEHKYRTEIGDEAFIGSDTLLVAPVRVGRAAKTGAGSVITHDIPDGELAYGVPARVRKKRDQQPGASREGG